MTSPSPPNWPKSSIQNFPDWEILKRAHPMKVSYDKETDSLTITLCDERIKESDEIRPGIIADFGYDGGVVRLEIMQASKVVGNAREMQFVVSE
jgi:uncharacterized protein YuzE